MLTPKDLVLLREALTYWAKEAVGLDSIREVDKPHSECSVEVNETDIQKLFQQRHRSVKGARHRRRRGSQRLGGGSAILRAVPQIDRATADRHPIGLRST